MFGKKSQTAISGIGDSDDGYDNSIRREKFPCERIEDGLFDHLFNKNSLMREEKIWELGDRIYLAENKQTIELLITAFGEYYRPVFLRNSLLEHIETLKKSETIEDFVYQCSVQSVDETPNKITITLHNGEQLIAKKGSNGRWVKEKVDKKAGNNK